MLFVLYKHPDYLIRLTKFQIPSYVTSSLSFGKLNIPPFLILSCRKIFTFVIVLNINWDYVCEMLDMVPGTL